MVILYTFICFIRIMAYCTINIYQIAIIEINQVFIVPFISIMAF